MQLLAQEEYGLRCLLAVARHGESGPLSIQQIARSEGISADYAAKLLRELRRGGLVTSTRGASGGYRLARPATRISVWDAIQVLGGALFPESFCECHPGRQRDCVHHADCSIRALWQLVDRTVRELLEGIRLADLARSEGQMTACLGEAMRSPRRDPNLSGSSA